MPPPKPAAPVAVAAPVAPAPTNLRPHRPGKKTNRHRKPKRKNHGQRSCDGPAASFDDEIIHLLSQPPSADKAKDATPHRPYKVNLYAEGGKYVRAKVDLNRNGKWDEKWAVEKNGEPVVKRQVSPSDDDKNYPDKFKLRGKAWKRPIRNQTDHPPRPPQKDHRHRSAGLSPVGNEGGIFTLRHDLVVLAILKLSAFAKCVLTRAATSSFDVENAISSSSRDIAVLSAESILACTAWRPASSRSFSSAETSLRRRSTSICSAGCSSLRMKSRLALPGTVAVESRRCSTNSSMDVDFT